MKIIGSTLKRFIKITCMSVCGDTKNFSVKFKLTIHNVLLSKCVKCTYRNNIFGKMWFQVSRSTRRCGWRAGDENHQPTKLVILASSGQTNMVILLGLDPPKLGFQPRFPQTGNIKTETHWFVQYTSNNFLFTYSQKNLAKPQFPISTKYMKIW